jgi:ABC-type Na+ efflux pump permease subunit
VYWVHIELVYGRWLGYFKESLTVGETTVMAGAVIFTMLGLSLLRTNWAAVKAWFGSLGPAPRRVSGD